MREIVARGEPAVLRGALADWSIVAAAKKGDEEAELGSGNAIYIPSLWWQAAASLDEIGAMVNFWWSDAEPPLLTPLNALYHAAITMKNLPAVELARWRLLFDHYIYLDHGDPAQHLSGNCARRPWQARSRAGRADQKAVDRYT